MCSQKTLVLCYEYGKVVYIYPNLRFFGCLVSKKHLA